VRAPAVASFHTIASSSRCALGASRRGICDPEKTCVEIAIEEDQQRPPLGDGDPDRPILGPLIDCLGGAVVPNDAPHRVPGQFGLTLSRGRSEQALDVGLGRGAALEPGFEARDLRYGGEIVEAYRGTGTCLGGMIQAAERLGVSLVPSVAATASPEL